MNMCDFLIMLSQGREIEFHIDNHTFFACLHVSSYTGLGSGSLKFCVYKHNNAAEMELVFEGTADELKSYSFLNRYTIQDNFAHFSIDWVM